jgi:hypothetical protein
MDDELGTPGASTHHRDLERELDDVPAGALRDSAPDVLAPIDPKAPVSGHTPMWEQPVDRLSHAPEHNFEEAVKLLMPALRPVGTTGQPISEIPPEGLDATSKAHTQPLVDEGPVGLAVVYTMAAGGFDVLVNGDHVLSWGVGISDVRDAAMGNLETWSATAPWTDEVSGDRRLLSSDTGEGTDAARIMLPEVREHLANELGSTGRVLVGLPERHLLLAGAFRPDDEEFAALFADFIVEQSGGADEPIDRRVFELVGGELVEFHP